MDTTVNTGYVSVQSAAPSTASSSHAGFASFIEMLERSRFGVIPVFLVLAACLGGFAAAIAVQHSLMLLAVIGLATGLVEVMLIAVTPMRITFWFLVAALVIDFIVFIA